MRDAGRIAWTAESLLARGPLAALSVFRRQNPANIELVIEDAPPAQEPAAHTGLDMQNKKLIALAIASLALPAIAAEAPAAALAASTAAPVAAPASAPDSESEDALDSVVNGLASASETGEASPEGEKAEEARTDAAQEVAEGTAGDKTGAADAKSEEKNEDAGAGSADESGADGVAELRTADAVSPLAIVPPFLDFMPYVTSLKDVEEVFGKNARLYDDGRYGRRHIITGQDFDLGVTSILVYYTDGGLLSDVFLRIPAKERPRVLEALREMTPSMNPDGIWTSDGGRDYWRTKTAELSVGPVKGDDFTVEYGATARQIRETRAWIEADPALCGTFDRHLDGGRRQGEGRRQALPHPGAEPCEGRLLDLCAQRSLFRGAGRISVAGVDCRRQRQAHAPLPAEPRRRRGIFLRAACA